MHLPVKRYLALLAIYLKPQWWRALLMTVCLLASIGLQLLNPQLLRYFIDTALANGATLTLLLVAALFIGIALLNQAVSVATTYLGEYVAWTATNRLRRDLVAHCLTLDMGFHKSHTSGELIERIDGDVNQLANFFSLFVVNLFSGALLLLGVLVLLLSISWLIGLAMVCFSIVAFMVLLLFVTSSILSGCNCAR